MSGTEDVALLFPFFRLAEVGTGFLSPVKDPSKGHRRGLLLPNEVYF